jgi:hypothetical protein
MVQPRAEIAPHVAERPDEHVARCKVAQKRGHVLVCGRGAVRLGPRVRSAVPTLTNHSALARSTLCLKMVPPHSCQKYLTHLISSTIPASHDVPRVTGTSVLQHVSYSLIAHAGLLVALVRAICCSASRVVARVFR